MINLHWIFWQDPYEVFIGVCTDTYVIYQSVLEKRPMNC